MNAEDISDELVCCALKLDQLLKISYSIRNLTSKVIASNKKIYKLVTGIQGHQGVIRYFILVRPPIAVLILPEK